MGHITKRNGRYQATYRGPDKRERTKTFDRRVDADRWLTSVEHAKLTSTYVDPAAGKVTFRRYAEDWRKMQMHRYGTERSAEQSFRIHVYPTFGDRAIGSIRASDIQALIRALSSSLAPRTVEIVYRYVAAVFRAAVRDRII
jgi:hypothetical protein